MPKLFEYFGLVVFSFAHDHKPIHVHGRYQDAEMKAEIIDENGKVVEIRIKHLKGKSRCHNRSFPISKKLVASQDLAYER